MSGVETRRVALVRYRGADGAAYVGSGLLVDTRTVLTADHVAEGTDHQCVGTDWSRDVSTVLRTSSTVVDLAVLVLTEPVPDIGRLGFARVNQGRVGQVSECVAVGFPRWKKEADARVSAQVTGMVPTAEGLRAEAAQGLREGLLTLVGDRDPAAPAIPSGAAALSDTVPTSQWGGMSGAVVTAGGMVLGVVRSHNLAAGGRSLTVTPVTAVERLPEDDVTRFWAALGVTDPHGLPVLPAVEGSTASVASRIVELRGRGHRLDFTGREREMSELHEHLTGEQRMPLVLHGLGGVGKTQLAIEYVDLHAREMNVVWMVRGDRIDVLTADLAALGDELGLSSPEKPDIEAELAAVRKWLNRNPGWLLLIDNVDNTICRDEVDRLLPESRTGRVLITSRIAAWPARYRMMPVTELPQADAAALLLTDATDDNEAAAGELAQELGRLPLALQQATAYSRTRGRTLAEYLTVLRDTKKQIRLLGTTADERDLPVAATWQVSIEQVRTEDAASGAILDLLAYLAPDAIPRQVFDFDDEYPEGQAEPETEPDMQTPGTGSGDASTEGDTSSLDEEPADPLEALYDLDEFDFDEALSVLHRYSLIQLSPEVITVHRLVQTVIRNSHSVAQAEVLATAAAALVWDALPELSHDARPQYQALLSHALAAAEHAAAFPSGADVAQQLLLLAGDYQRDRGQYAAAKATLQRLLQLTEAEGDTEQLLEVLGLFNSTLVQSGDYAQALPHAQRALKIAEDTYASDDSAILVPLNDLGTVLWQLGRSAEAEPYLRRALAIAERRYGPEHQQAQLPLGTLGGVLQQLGRSAEAEPYLRRALDIAEREYGTEASYTLAPLTNLGTVVHQLGRPAEAEPYLRRALEIAEREYGVEHPQSLNPVNNFGTVVFQLGRPAEAEPYLRRALDIAEREYGVEHPMSLLPLSNLGTVLTQLGRSAEAEPFLRRAVAIAEHEYGPAHAQILLPLSNLGTALLQLGRTAETEAFLRRAVTIAEHEYGPEHAQTLTPLITFGTALLQLGRTAEAEPFLRRAMAIAESAYGPAHAQTLAALTNFGMYLWLMGRSAEAEPLVRRAVAIAEHEYGAAHAQAIAPLTKLGTILCQLGRPAEAEPYLRRALGIAEHEYGPEHRVALEPLTRLGDALWRRLGRSAEAEPYLRRAVAIAEHEYGPEHRQALLSLDNLGGTLWQLGRPAEAEPYLRRALAIAEHEFGPEHRETLEPLSILGDALSRLGRSVEAEPYLRRALATAEKLYGHQALALLPYLRRLGDALASCPQPTDVAEVRQRLVDLNDHLGNGTAQAVDDLLQLAVTREAAGQGQEAALLREKAAQMAGS
jgi:tetratricopeptide (TPR) repeat protein